MQYCQGGKKSKRFSPGSDFTEQIFTGELSRGGFSCVTGTGCVGLIYDYSTNWKGRFKIKNHYSLWRDLIFGAPQRLILGPLLFNLCHLFMFTNNIEVARYADDTTPS